MIHTYPADFESKIGFAAIRAILKERCSSNLGRAHVDDMGFSSVFERVSLLLSQTEEMRALLTSGNDIPAPAYFDVGPAVSRLNTEGAYMNAENLLRLLRMLEAMKEVRSFYCRSVSESGSPMFPALFQEFAPLQEFPMLVAEISRVINKFGEVADNASDTLYSIRKQMAAAQGSVSRAMRRALDRAIAAGVVDKDTSASIRDSRMVIPVPAGQKRQINGIVHDESATGKTVFIEPAEVVEASNRLRELQIEEQREIVVILTELSALIRPHIEEIIAGLSILGRLDFITAKARFAIDIDASLPVIENTPEIDWYHAVHPVLLLSLRKQGKEVVPLSLRLDKTDRFLIVSGPNAGGKSVVLKTVGVVQYMAQCGLLPPLYSNSHVGIFDSLFVDIGDQQSIENDLSTYSSHLKNMKFFLQRAGKKTLVLVDEMGSGTEPQIGGALAQAILARLAESGCMGIVTTHYQNLKNFADDTEGLVNGAMIYDRQNLRPTFQLSVGNPGSSFALEIARNIGLPQDVVESAKEIVGSDYVNFEKNLMDIDRDRRYWSNKRRSVKEKEAKLDALLAKYEDSSSDLRSQRSAILRQAREEAKEIMATANQKIEAAIREIRDAQAEKERTREIRRSLDEYRHSLKEDSDLASQPEALKPLRHKSRRAKDKKPAADTQSQTGPIEIGAYVKMSDGGVSGKVLSIQGTRAEVAFGSLRTFVELKKLKRVGAPKVKETSGPVVVSASVSDESRSRQLNFKREIDVRGMRADEALQAVTYFIDDAVQFGADRVRILHGTGQGILKTLIREQLRVNPIVRHFADEDVRFGGAGITVVDLD